MNHTARRYFHGQGGYTLIEVIIAVAIGAILMAGLTSVVLTSVRAGDVASSRVEASGQIRNFEYFAYDDFAGSGVPSTGDCGPPPCTTQPIVLVGTRVSDPAEPVPSPSPVTYTWDRPSGILYRQATGTAIEAATGVRSFSWYVDRTTATPTVVVSITIKVRSYNQSQTLLFYPRVNP